MNSNIIEVHTATSTVRADTIRGINVNFKGNNNYISLYEGTQFEKCNFSILGNNNKIIFGKTPYKIACLDVFCGSFTTFKIGNLF